jgi:hypothetical protein
MPFTRLLACYGNLRAAMHVTATRKKLEWSGYLVTVTLTDEAQRPCYLALSHTSVGFFSSCPADKNGYEVF